MDVINLSIIALFLVITYVTIRQTNKSSEQAKGILEESIACGQNHPPSLHPIIDDSLCIGCGACVDGCPEKEVLGLIYGKAALIGASSCVGHGICRTQCPADAITLVLGTVNKGVTIPELDHSYQTATPGLYVAGELGGMGLIRNAVRQGKLAVHYMLNKWQDRAQAPPIEDGYDLVIIGCGPAGLAAALYAKEQGLRFLIVEQDTALGGAIASFPRQKLVMGTDVELPLYGKLKARTLTKEELLEVFLDAIGRFEIPVAYSNRVSQIVRREDGTFETHGSQQVFRSHKVLLALGRRGTPRKPGVPGQDLPKVAYSLREPEAYAGCRVMIVGGGDSALEAACSLAGQPGTKVTLSYRGENLWRAKKANLAKTQELAAQDKIELVLGSHLEEITTEHVLLRVDEDGTIQRRKNDAVFVFIGGTLPIPFLEQAGVNMRTVYGEEIAAV